MCVAGHFLHIHQDPDAAAVQAEGRSGEIYRLQIQVLSPAFTHYCNCVQIQMSDNKFDIESNFLSCVPNSTIGS